MCRGHALTFQSMGYPCSTTPVSDLGLNEHDLLTTYHLRFLADDNDSLQGLDLVLATWEPTTENESFLETSHPDTVPNLLQAYMATHLRPTRRQRIEPPPPRDAHLPAHISQGMSSAPPVPTQMELTRIARSLVTIDPTERNPDQDIVPTRTYTLQRGLTKIKDGEVTTTNKHLVYAYTPTGSCVGTMVEEITQALLCQFTQLMNPLEAFPMEVVKLLLRQAVKHDPKQPTGQWKCPDRLMSGLQALGEYSERFASPLDRSPHSGSFWSAHPDDVAFGANLDAYSTPWVGLSHAYPGDSPEQSSKAIRWAIASAEAYPQHATCTVIVLPFNGGEAQMKHLTHQSVTPIAYCQANPEPDHAFVPIQEWQRGAAHALTKNHRPHARIVIAITNKAGKETYLTEAKLSMLQDRWNGGQSLPNRVTRACSASPLDSPPVVTPPYALTRLIQSGNPPIIPTRCSTASTAHRPAVAYSTSPLCSPAEGVTYTDGSCIKLKDGTQSIGAAVYFKGTTYTVNPNGKGPTNTNNRAELCGLLAALSGELGEMRPYKGPLHIYTDSLCSLYWIRRILDSPWTLAESKQYQLLTEIGELLLTRAQAGQATHFYKVRAHTGQEGNEHADEGAKLAAIRPDAERDYQVSCGNDPYAQKTWVKIQPPPKDRERSNKTPAPYFAGNLTKALKTFLNKKCSGGSFHTAGIYAEAWNKALPSLTHASVAGFWSDSAIPWATKMLCFKARWGQMWTNKMAHRYGLTPTSTCSQCHEEDGVGHALGGCHAPEPAAMRIERHNQAVRTLRSAISKGAKGGYYMLMDAGSAKDLPTGVSGTRLKQWMLPSLPGSELSKLRPDILLIGGLDPDASDDQAASDAKQSPATLRFYVIEVGFGGDTDLDAKASEKQEQHKRLVQLLREQGYQVQYHAIPIGRTGVIPRTVLNSLAALGVGHQQAQACTNKLSRNAALYVKKFYAQRQHHAHQGQVRGPDGTHKGQGQPPHAPQRTNPRGARAAGAAGATGGPRLPRHNYCSRGVE